MQNRPYVIGEEILVKMDWNLDSLSCYFFSDLMQLHVNCKSSFLFHHQQVT